MLVFDPSVLLFFFKEIKPHEFHQQYFPTESETSIRLSLQYTCLNFLKKIYDPGSKKVPTWQNEALSNKLIIRPWFLTPIFGHHLQFYSPLQLQIVKILYPSICNQHIILRVSLFTCPTYFTLLESF